MFCFSKKNDEQFINDYSSTEEEPLLAGQIRSAPTPAMPARPIKPYDYTLVHKAIELFIAAASAGTALSGSYAAAGQTWNNDIYKLIMSLAGYSTAVTVNFTASPIASIKKLTNVGAIPNYAVWSSKLAALCSAFLAIGAPLHLVNMIRALMEKKELEQASWLFVGIGLLMFCANYWTSKNVGEIAYTNFKLKCPKIKDDLQKHGWKAGFALIMAALLNLVMAIPYIDGPPDAIAGMALSKKTGNTTAEEVLSVLQSLFFGSAAVHDNPHYKPIYWGTFAAFTPANLISLSTYTFGITYEFFFKIAIIFERMLVYICCCAKANPVLSIFDTATKSESSNSLLTQFVVYLIAAILTFAYASAFIGFDINTLSSKNWFDNILSPSEIKALGFTAGSLTWGLTLFELLKNTISPVNKEKTIGYLLLQKQATLLFESIKNTPEPNRYYLNIKEDAGFVLYKKTSPQQFPEIETLHTESLNRADIIEMISELLTGHEMVELRAKSLRLLKNPHADPRVTQTVKKTIKLDLRDERNLPIHAEFECHISYHPNAPIEVNLYYLANNTLTHIVSDRESQEVVAATLIRNYGSTYGEESTA